MATLESKALDVITAVTAVVVLTYLVAWIAAIAMGEATIREFIDDIGPWAGALVIYWVRGAGTPVAPK